MTCPKCGGYTNVVDSRVQVDGVYRRRECAVCRCRFSTLEIDMDLYKILKNAAVPDIQKKVKQAVGKVEKCFADLLVEIGSGDSG